jgi:hypothetical protein
LRRVSFVRDDLVYSFIRSPLDRRAVGNIWRWDVSGRRSSSPAWRCLVGANAIALSSISWSRELSI